jgi:hypothetical protein
MILNPKYGALEIEVTSAMIEAGLDEFLDLCPELMLPPTLAARDLVGRIISASLGYQTVSGE